MRNILFRAKRTDNGEWAEGSLLVETHDIAGNIEKRCKISDITYGQDDEGFATYMSGVEEYVDPDTVGEWTGLYDKNGKRIFEGDILAQPKYPDETCLVIYKGGHFAIRGLSFRWLWDAALCDYNKQVEVIGNVHDGGD